MTTIVTITLNPSIDVSAATEAVEPIRKLRCFNQRRDPGGGGINVARVVTRLGGTCRAIYPAGGSPGCLLHRLLDAEGVLSLSVEATADTRESFTVLERRSGDQYRFILPGSDLAEAEWQACLRRLETLGEPPGYVVVSGSLPPGVPAEIYGRIADIAAQRGARMVLDSSGQALAAALEAGVFLVKPNLRELGDLTGRPLDRAPDWEDAAASLVRSGKAEVVALTLGDRGAFLASREVVLRAAPLEVEIASAVGAGDSFLAAMVWHLCKGDGLEDAFRYAVAAGTAALLTGGTELCRRADVERLADQVTLS